MARILFAWELGKGYGHIIPYVNIIRELKKQGHNIIFASRDVGTTENIYGADRVKILQAPFMMHKIDNTYRIQYSFVHLLHNCGFGEVKSLYGLMKAWMHIYHYVQPDLVIFDHSPIGLLAAKKFTWKRIISGAGGFLNPPHGQPIPKMRYWQKYDQERLIKEEAALLAKINHVLAAEKVKPLGSVAELYQADDEFLLTFKELDQYPMREHGNYLGMFTQQTQGIAPEWPGNFDRKVFAYLHTYKHLPDLLKTLAQGNFSTIIYAPDLPKTLRNKFQTDKVKFSTKALDIRQVAEECNLAITNGTFGTTAEFIKYGTPVLVIPTNLERVMTARRIVDIGAGVAVKPDQPKNLKGALRQLFLNDKYHLAAETFAERYKDLDIHWQTEKMLESIARLLPASDTRAQVQTESKNISPKMQKTTKKTGTPKKTYPAKKVSKKAKHSKKKAKKKQSH